MKKIIDGKKYNTETANKVAEWTNGYNRSDFNYVSEDLYLKKTGEFFLHGEGGANSCYSESAGNSSWGSEQIIPLSEKEAKSWFEKKGDADDYEKIFGEVEE